MSDEQDVQALAYTAKVVEGYLNDIVARETLLSRLFMEHKAALEAIENLPEDVNIDCMLPIGGGVSIPVRVDGRTKYLVSVGAGVFLEKDRSDTIYYLNKRVQQIEQALKTASEQRQRLEGQFNALQEKLREKLAQERQGS